VGYQADIQIAVKGAKQLQDLTNKIKATGKDIDALNQGLSAVAQAVPASFSNLSKALKDARKNFDDAARGSSSYGTALNELIQAEKLYNAELEERNRLLTKVKATEAAAARKVKPGSTGFRAADYGPRMSPAMERRANAPAAFQQTLKELAQTAKVISVSNTNTRTAWNTFFKNAAQTAKSLNVARTNTRTAWSTFFQDAAQTANAIKTAQLNTRTSWIKALEGLDETAKDIRRANTTRKRRGKVAAGRRKQRQLQNIQLGVGFPLLFGGGPGSVAGGGLGALFDKGGGFGGQIIGSAIGQALDQAVEKVAAIGQAIEDIDASALQEAIGSVSTDLAYQVDLLNSIGEKERARVLLQEEVTRQTGLANDSAQDINNAVKLLQQGWTQVVNTVSGLVGIIGAPLAAALGVILSGVAFVVKGINLILTKIGALIKFMGQFIIGKENAEKLAEALSKVGQQIDENELKLRKERDQYQINVARLKRSRQESNVLLARELEIMRMTSQEDKVRRTTAEALLKVDRERLKVEQARREFSKARNEKDFDKQFSALEKIGSASDALRRAEVEAEIAVQAERVYNFYTAQADALQGVVHQSKIRLNSEAAVLGARNKLTNAYYSAELKVNSLAIQRAKQKGDLNQALQLEIKQVELIYKQTIAQIQAEIERARLKAREVALSLKLLEVDNLRKQAAGTLQDADRQALQLKRQALGLAKYNVRVTEQVAEQQIRGAQATRTASIESLRFAANQERVAQAANNTARAMGRAANAASKAAKAAGGRNDTFFVNGKEYTYQGSRTSNIIGSGVTIVNKSHNFNNQAANSALHGAIARGSSSQYSGSSQPSSSPQGGGGGRRPTRTVNLPGGGSITTVGNMPGTNRAGMGGSVTYNAEGSYVTRPITSLIGERGENEYVIPESKMNSAMKRYARGTRGESVVEGSGETSAAGRKRSGAVVNISTGPVMQMDGQDYVTVSDLNDAVGNVAAAMSSSGSEGYGGKARLS
jgi:hypothetical protein